MIFSIVIFGFFGLISGLFSLLPVVSLPENMATAINFFAEATRILGPLVPWTTIVEVIVVLMTFEVTFMTFKLLTYFYNRIPTT